MDKVQYVQSKLLTKAGVQHGWFMRYGGVSTDLFESLNGKKGIGDSDENVDENRRRALAGLCHPEFNSESSCSKDSCLRRSDNLAYIYHQFKTDILHAKANGEFNGYDASLTTENDLVLAQTTADCGTVIISDTSGTVLGLVHGSWHTLKDNIICKLVAEMKSHTSLPLIAGLGPMICKNCYEFGPEAANLFDAKYLTSTNKKYLVDLRAMIIDQLLSRQITQIDDVNICTLEDERFFSHRRSGAHSGRFLTLVKRPS